MNIRISENHPNFLPWEGVACRVEEYSSQRVHMLDEVKKQLVLGPKLGYTRAAMEDQLPFMVGMALNVNPNDLENHWPRSACGIVTAAWIDGNEVKVSGGIFGNEWPDAVAAIENGELGLCPLIRNAVTHYNLEDPGLAVISKFSFSCLGALVKHNCGFTNSYIRLVHVKTPMLV
jgi:hypothetical protein